MAGDERADGRYRGTLALNLLVPRGRREVVVGALDMWEHGIELRGTATIDRVEPFWQRFDWAIATDAGGPYRRLGGGGGSLQWEWHFEPAIPDEARQLAITIGADRLPGGVPGDPAPVDPAVVVDLTDWPPTAFPSPTSFDEVAELDPRRGPIPNLEREVSVRPIKVLPVSAQLGVVAGRDLNVLSIETYPTWFLLHLAGSGPLVSDADQGAESVMMACHQRLARRWTANDDRGGHYDGSIRSSHSGYPWRVDAPFTPALDPEATALRLSFPNPFGAGVVTTELGLHR